jgi:dihydropteroate synthase
LDVFNATNFFYINFVEKIELGSLLLLKVIKNMTLNINGSLFDLSSPKVMGILNVTPDSFYDGGNFSNHNEIIKYVSKMISEGADIIDVGGYSSRPGAKNISVKEEEDRVIPIVKLISKTFRKTIISVDTFRSEIATKALDSGASIINDISGGELDPQMYKSVGQFKAPYIIMHMKGNPSNMQDDPKYNNVVVEVIKNLSNKINKAENSGIIDVLIDPGFGFGKTLKHNYKLLNDLKLFKILERPILAGLSRKSMIYKILKNSPEEALTGTISLNTIALINGANILRVHDVKEAKETIKLFNCLQKNI